MKIPFRRTPVGDRYVMQELKTQTMVLWVESLPATLFVWIRPLRVTGLSQHSGLSGDARKGQEFA